MAQEAVGSSPITHPIEVNELSGCGAVRLAHLLWEQGVGGSNPLTPTDDRHTQVDIKPFFIEGLLFYQKYVTSIKYFILYLKGDNE